VSGPQLSRLGRLISIEPPALPGDWLPATPPNKGMKLTKPVNFGTSQLIPSVGRTSEDRHAERPYGEKNGRASRDELS